MALHLKIWGGKKNSFQSIFLNVALFDIFSETKDVLDCWKLKNF